MIQNFVTLFNESMINLCATLFLISLLSCFVLTRFNGVPYISKRASDDLKAVQSSHIVAVSRIGGLAVFFSLALLVPLSFYFSLIEQNLIWLTFSAKPIFAAGFLEDLGYHVSPRKRLAAAFISSILVILIFDVWVTRQISHFDNLFNFAPLGILFTAFAAAVFAFNLIDGLNGFSSYVTISIALSLIAVEGNQRDISVYFWLLISIVLGFLILNFPNGKIFLGDAGAYLLGHILVWLAIILVNLDKSIHSFAILLVFFWPVADTLLAIWRRWQMGARADRPDRLHFHQLTMRFLEIKFFGRRKRNISNPLATCILVPFVSVPQFLGVIFAREPTMSFIIIFLISLLFVFSYSLMIKSANRINFEFPFISVISVEVVN